MLQQFHHSCFLPLLFWSLFWVVMPIKRLSTMGASAWFSAAKLHRMMTVWTPKEEGRLHQCCTKNHNASSAHPSDPISITDEHQYHTHN